MDSSTTEEDRATLATVQGGVGESDAGEAPADGPFSIGVVTLFPELFAPFIETSFVGRGQRSSAIDVRTFDLRAQGHGRHQSVDDTPYGGGSGMVMRVDCVVGAIEEAEAALGVRSRRILMTPQGRPLTARVAEELSRERALVLVCGRYEGFDERVRSFVDDELSLGDFVLTGGEIPAMAVIEATIRFRDGVLGNVDSKVEESFSPSLFGMLEYPQYTRPAEFRGMGVPEVLKSGDHARIAQFRRRESLARTRARRPDLVPEELPPDSVRGRRDTPT